MADIETHRRLPHVRRDWAVGVVPHLGWRDPVQRRLDLSEITAYARRRGLVVVELVNSFVADDLAVLPVNAAINDILRLQDRAIILTTAPFEDVTPPAEWRQARVITTVVIPLVNDIPSPRAATIG